MKDKEHDEFLKQKDFAEYNKMISDIEQNMYQRDHWKRQQMYWIVIVTVAVVVAVISVFFDLK